MQVTIISVGGDPIVHKAGCAHLNRQSLRSDVKYDLDVETATAAAEDFWSDFLASGEMTADEAFGNTQFAPCVSTLPTAVAS